MSVTDLRRVVQEHEQGDLVEPITYPNYSAAARKRKRAELKDAPDKTLKVGNFAVLDVQNDDPHYRLRLGLVKITRITDDDIIHFQWYMYSGYPDVQNPDYGTRWFPQILAGKGQKVDTGECHTACVILTFPSLTKSRTIPNTGRVAPLKMIRRVLSGEFGRLSSTVTGACESEGDSSSSDDDAPLLQGGAVASLRRSKRLKYALK